MGFRAVEITLDTPGAVDVVARVAALVPASCVVGVGTVTRAEQVQAAAKAGARFAVSPVAPPGMIEAWCARELRCCALLLWLSLWAACDSHAAGVLAVPAASTPHEMFMLHRQVADVACAAGVLSALTKRRTDAGRTSHQAVPGHAVGAVRPCGR